MEEYNEFKKLRFKYRIRIELANRYLELRECKWYEFNKKRNYKNRINLMLDTYTLQILEYLK